MTVGRAVSGSAGHIDMGIRGSRLLATIGAAVFCVALLLPALAFASDAPHVTTPDGPDACAMCHRGHTAPGVVGRSQAGSWDATGSALVIADPGSDTGDQSLCLTCHGIDGFGSTLDVQSDLLRSSVHSMTPEPSDYGPSAKQCSSCHDAHGTEKDPLTDLPFARLLRAFTSTGDAYYGTEAYCATCHFDPRDEQSNRFDGLDIYEQTAHFSGLAAEAPDTGVTCSICHAAHGSDYPPLIRPAVLPSGPATETIPIAGNDRSLCYVCHETDHVTYGGDIVYDDSIHGLSEIAVPVLAEWNRSEETTRLAGECQNCHNAMGADDGEGNVIPKLVEAEGREVCYSCHNEELAAETGGVVVDMASAGVRPYADGEAGAELIAAWDPENLPLSYSALHVYTQVRGVDAPRDLEGPRRYLAEFGTRSSSLAAGDIDGVGDRQLVVADPSRPYLTVMRYDPLSGLAPASYLIAEAATYVEVGDFTGVHDADEIATVSISATGESTLRVYRLQPNGGGASLVQAGIDYDVGWSATGLASGDLGGAMAGLVVTSLGPSAEETTGPGAVFVLGDPTGSTLDSDSFEAQVAGPRGPSIGPVRSAGVPGIVIANSAAAAPSISVYSPDGLSHDEFAVFPGAGAAAWDTAVGEFLPESAGSRLGVGVAVRNETAGSAVSVFRVTGTGVQTPRADIPTGEDYAATSALAVGDVDGDGVAQLVAGNAGVFSRTINQSESPSIQVLRINGAATGLEVADTHWAGGVEMAGDTPSLAIVDLGPVGRSRHPASAIPGAHDSEEEGDFARHAECVDCHNPHTMTPDETPPVAPAAYGLIAGAWGVDLDVAWPYALKRGIEYEYELCFKCHTADWGQTAPPSRDILAEFDPGPDGSAHPVMADSAEGRVFCIDCHGNAGAPAGEPAGPHVSTSAPLLREPFFAARPLDAASQLCYNTCHHDFGVYYSGNAGSRFYDQTSGVQLHERHVRDYGMACQSCHTNHGSPNNFLIRTDIDWVEAANGGGCYTPCHSDTSEAGNAYSRSTLGDADDVTSVVNTGNGLTENAGNPAVQDGNYFTVREAAGSNHPVLRVEMTFDDVVQLPTSFEFYGYYYGPGVQIHTLEVTVWDYSMNAGAGGWASPALGTINRAEMPSGLSFAIPAGDYLSAGQMRFRLDHPQNGNQNHLLYLDRVWLRY